MFEITKSDAGVLTVRKKGLRGGNARFEQDDLNAVREWLPNRHSDLICDSIRIFADQDSIVLKGLDSTEMTVKEKDIPALQELLDDVANYEVIDESVDELAQDIPEEPEPEESKLELSTVKMDPSLAGTLVSVAAPLGIHVYRIAYLRCDCGNELRLEHKDNYNNLALICPNCSQVVLLED